MAGALSTAGQVFDFQVQRRVDGRDVIFHVQMEPKELNHQMMGKIYAFGIVPGASLTIEDAKGSQFRRGDRIVRIAGQSVQNSWDIEPVLQEHPNEPVALTVLRGGKEVQIALQQPLLLNKSIKPKEDLLLDLLGLESRILIEDVQPGQPADKARLHVDDIITRYGDVANPSRAELMAINKEFADRDVSITVERYGKSVTAVIRPQKQDDRVLIGITPFPVQDETLVAEAIPGSAAAKAGLAKGAVVTQINGQPVKTWRDVYAQLRLSQAKPVTITYTLTGQEKTWEVPELTKELFDPSHFTFALPVPPTLEWAGLKTEPIHGGPLQAIVWSAEDTYDWVASSYKTLRSIISGRVGPKGIAGPVGIGQMAIRTARRGPVDFAYFIAMLSTMLAFFNFLPFPVLDGGHFVLVLIEKVRGRPLPAKLIASIQITGLAIIIGVFLLVTFNDILRVIRLK
jgi:regulator of sigma E protease